MSLAADQLCVSRSVQPSLTFTLQQFIIEPTAAHQHTHRVHARSSTSSLTDDQQNTNMGKINGCLKCLFIFFNVLFVLIGCGLIYVAVKTSGFGDMMSATGGPSLAWTWVFAIGTLGISCLGIFAGCSEKELVLKIFAGFMVAGMLIMLIFGIVVVVTRNKAKAQFTAASSEIGRELLKDEKIRVLFEDAQANGQCCGVGSAEDWGDEIPDSCACAQLFPTTCKAKPQGLKGPAQIYARGCGEFIFLVVDIVFKIGMGICFGFSVTALLGLLVSLLMIYQVKRHDNSGGASIAMKGY